MCWTPSYTRHKTKTRKKRKNTTQCVFDTIIHKTHDEGKQNKKKRNTICVEHNCAQTQIT